MVNYRKYVYTAALFLIAAVFAVAGFFLLRRNQQRSVTSALPRNPNVILITVDTTRADHLPVYGYKQGRTPNLDSLAKNGVVFEQCATTSPLTLPAHCSIMTGTYPTYHGVRINGNTALSGEHLTMAEAFAANGYETSAFIAAFVLDGRWGLNQGFDHYDDQFDLKKYKKLDLGMVQRPANQMMDAALTWLQSKKDKRFFTWIHLYDPHTPYEPPASYRSNSNSKSMTNLYDAEITFMDEQIGRCLSWVAENDLQQRTIVAVIGDHGEGLGEHGELTHGYFIYDYAVHVPFILSIPSNNVKGVRIGSQVRTVDLYPTLLQASGISIPKNVQGVSLWSLIEGRKEPGEGRFAYSESMAPSIQYGWSPLLSLRTAKYKFIDAPRKEFYNLEKDPDELHDVQKEIASIAAHFEKRLKSVVAETSAGAPGAANANLDSETVERLAALGYIGAPVQTKAGKGSHTLVDPKDRLSVHEAINKAGELNSNELYSESAAVLEQVLSNDPSNPQARLLLATNYMELKRPDDAQKLLESLLNEDPQNVRALVSLAKILQDAGQSDEVIRLCRNVLEVDERNTQALSMMGQAYLDMHNFQEARGWLEKAVEVQPKLTQNQLNLAACLIGLKKYNEAERTLHTILKDNPKFPRAHFNLGLLYEEQGKLVDATREYETEIQHHGNSYMARFNLGRIKMKTGDHFGYMEQMKEVIRIAPKNAAGYLFLARGLLKENANPEEILRVAEQGLTYARSPEHKAMAYFILADVYNRKKQVGLVRQALTKANEYKTKIPHYE